MGEMAAKAGDRIEGTDTHMINNGVSVSPVSGHEFRATLTDNLSVDVLFEGKAAAYLDSVALNDPKHVPKSAGSFSPVPENRGRVTKGSATVMINGNPAARNNDTATTCNDPPQENTGRVVVDTSTVFIGE